MIWQDIDRRKICKVYIHKLATKWTKHLSGNTKGSINMFITRIFVGMYFRSPPQGIPLIDDQ